MWKLLIRENSIENDIGGVTMQKWMKDGLTGLGPVAALTLIVSVVTDAPYTLFSTVIYSLFVGIVLGIPGGILVGRGHEGWGWPFAGGTLSALVVGLLLIIIRIF
jgi:hypothetical protein